MRVLDPLLSVEKAQSWTSSPMRVDLHHLVTCERKCNSFRGNSSYTEYADYLEVVRERCGKEAASFEPTSGKGPVARATLHFLIRYPTPGRYSEEAMAMLLHWHVRAGHGVRAPPQRRGLRAAGNRNPLVDHPVWASRIAFKPG